MALSHFLSPTRSPALPLLLLWATLMVPGARGEPITPDPRLHLVKGEYGYWAPEIHEMYLCVSVLRELQHPLVVVP